MALTKETLSASIRLALGDGEAPPKEFRIFAAGTFDTTKGPFTFDGEASASVMRCAQEYGNELCLDYNHGMADGWPVDPSLAAKAAGWFTPVLRGGELWAENVRWTAAAAAAISAKEWRYISPWFSCDPETRRIHELHNVALTNTPATKNLKPLTLNRAGAASLESTTMKSVLNRLGLSETATERDALSAIADMDAKLATAAGHSANHKAQVDEMLGLTGQASFSAALGVAKAWKESHEKLPAVTAELSGLKADTQAGEVKRTMDEASAAGKLTPAERPAMEALAKLDFAQVKALLSTRPAVVSVPAVEPKVGAAAGATLSMEEQKVATAAGMSHAEFAAAKAARSTGA